jgi:hypothetical protein
MRFLLTLLMTSSALALVLAGCGGGVTPPLVEPGQPTLVFIYTEG